MECSDSDLDDRVRTLELERRRIEAELALTAGEIDRRRSYLDDGHRSLKAYLRATCNYSDAEAARVGRLTTAAADVPGLAEALHEGHIGTPQANELAVAHTNRRVRDRLREFAPMLLDQAERLSFREFRTCVKRFVMLADLDGAHHDLDESIQNRRAHVVNLNGSLCLDAGGGDPLVNVELEAIFRHFCELEYDADVAARRAEHGDRADEHPLPRTATQRGYDAFVAIMRGALANHEAGRPAPATEPLVNILMDHRTWGRLLAERGLAPDATLAGEQVDPFTGLASPDELLAELMADPDSIGSRRCETSTGQVLDPHTVLRAALAGHIRRVVLGADNLPINLGRKARVFTGPARRGSQAPRRAVRPPRLRPARRTVRGRPLHRMARRRPHRSGQRRRQMRRRQPGETPKTMAHPARHPRTNPHHPSRRHDHAARRRPTTRLPRRTGRRTDRRSRPPSRSPKPHDSPVHDCAHSGASHE